MAVMSSEHPEVITFEHKIEPVPSSDKMALDLEINGNSNRDNAILDAPSEFPVHKAAPPTSDEASLEHIVASSDANAAAFASNHILVPAPIDLATEAAGEAPSPSSLPSPSPNPDSGPTNTDLTSSSSLEAQPPDTSAGFTSIESAIEAAVEDVAASTTVPTPVEAQESDLRHETIPLAAADSLTVVEPEQSSSIEASNHNLNSTVPAVETLQIESDVAPLGSDATAETDRRRVDSESARPETVLEATSARVTPVAAVTPHSRDPKSPLESKENSDHDLKLDVKSDPSAPSNMSTTQDDTEMVDSSEPSIKVSRDREDDEEMGPSAKRTKTDPDEVMADAPSLAEDNEESSVKDEVSGITAHQVKEIIKVLKNTARTKDGKSFSEPVPKLWPTIADQYAEKISNPIDLQTIETKLKSSEYASMQDFQADVRLIHLNAATFNGAVHTVTTSAQRVRDTIIEKTANIPAEPAVPPPKEKKAKRPTPSADSAPRNAAPRRMSREIHATPAAPPAPTFALDPTTSTPLIRRDSTKGDGGRPKREIHPPKNKDLPYTVRPKSKKYMTELRFCEEVLNELQRTKHHAFNHPFLIPVDPVALNIPNYFTVIKKPMDLSTVGKKLKEGTYSTAAEFEKDVRQILINCYKFNPVGNVVRKMGQDLEDLFNTEWEKKDQWISEHSPSAATPVTDGDTEEEEEEEDDDISEQQSANALSALKERLLTEQQKLIAIMTDKTSDSIVLSMQQEMVNIVQKKINEETAKKKKPTKKPKPPKSAKKAAPARRSAPTKKAAGNRRSDKYLGTLEKETISTGLGLLPEKVMEMVVDLIKKEKPDLQNEEDGTMEMDIDAISVPLLWKIHGLIMQYNPDVEAGLREQMRGEQDSPSVAAKPAAKKKNKPMSKYEQERRIQSLTQKVGQFERLGSNSQEPVIPTVERQEDSSSGDESASEEE